MSTRTQARCDAAQVEALLFGELPVATAATVQTHVGHCPDCGKHLADLKQTRAALHGADWHPAEPIAPLYPAIAARVRALSDTKLVFRRMALAMTFACLLVLVGLPGLDRGMRPALLATDDCGPSMCVEPVVCEGSAESPDPIAALEARYSACMVATPVPSVCRFAWSCTW